MDIWDDEEWESASFALFRLRDRCNERRPRELDAKVLHLFSIFIVLMDAANSLKDNVLDLEQQLGTDATRVEAPDLLSFLSDDERSDLDNDKEFFQLLGRKTRARKRLRETFLEIRKTRLQVEILLVNLRMFQNGERWRLLC